MSDALLIIDPQNDFCRPDGALSVPGADADMERLAAFVDRKSACLAAIHVSLDSHQRLDVSHPIWFVDSAGAHPAPFTVVTAADIQTGRWRCAVPGAQARTQRYLEELEANGRYPHVIWPEHCLVGSPGHNVYGSLAAALARYEARPTRVHFHLKGQNPWTEHFSAVQAEVPDPADVATLGNPALVAALMSVDRVYVAGEASSHCVANTVRDLVAAGVPAGRLCLLTDACSPVPGFSAYAETFVRELLERGMTLATTEQ